MKNKQMTYVYALSAVLLWSTVAAVFKLTLAYITPVELLLFSTFFSLLFFTAYILKNNDAGKIVLTFQQHKSVILFSSLLNPFLYYLLLFKAYALLPAQEAQAINYTWGLMLAYLSVPLLGHTLTKRDILAGFLCYSAVYIIATRGELFTVEFASLQGVILALTSTLVWALYWISNTRIKADPVIILFLNFFFALLFLIAYILAGNIEISIPEPKALLGTLYIGLFEMGISFVLWLKAMKLTDNTAKISNLIYLSPLLSLFFIQTFLGEKIMLSTVIALLLIFMGLFIQKWKRKNT